MKKKIICAYVANSTILNPAIRFVWKIYFLFGCYIFVHIPIRRLAQFQYWWCLLISFLTIFAFVKLWILLGQIVKVWNIKYFFKVAKMYDLENYSLWRVISSFVRQKEKLVRKEKEKMKKVNSWNNI